MRGHPRDKEGTPGTWGHPGTWGQPGDEGTPGDMGDTSGTRGHPREKGETPGTWGQPGDVGTAWRWGTPGTSWGHHGDRGVPWDKLGTPGPPPAMLQGQRGGRRDTRTPPGPQGHGGVPIPMVSPLTARILSPVCSCPSPFP
nr:PREDICTED: collagen alpha-1(VI) chain-like [Opisthocomus hoazin]